MSKFVKPKGINFSCFEEIPIQELSENLLQIISFLTQIHPKLELNRYEDWWEHDGLHFYRGKVDFDELQRTVTSDRLLQEFKLGDFDVFIGIAPKNNSWYLRFYLDNEENLGRFDITLSDEIAEDFEKEILNKLTLEMKKQSAVTYYKSMICH